MASDAPSTATPQQPSGRHRWRRWLLFAGLVYLGVFILLLLLERWLIFHPTSADSHWIEPPSEIRAEDVVLSLDNKTNVHAWWCVPEGWHPSHGAVLYSHGNAGNLSHRAESVRRWQEQFGVAVLLYDYPGYGRSTGKPSEAGCYAAGQAFHDWLTREQGLSAERIILLGMSLGGGVAVEFVLDAQHHAKGQQGHQRTAAT